MRQELDKKIQNGYSLDLGSLIDKSFEPFKKTFLISGIGIFIIGLFILALYFLLAIVLFGFTDFIGTLTKMSLNANQTNVLVGTAIFTAISSAIFAPLTAGFINVNRLAVKGDAITIGNLFEFYNSKFTKDILICYAIIGLINGVVNAGCGMINLSFIGFIFQGVFACATVFSIPIIIYSDQQFGDAISKSIALFLKQPFIIVIALLVAYLIAMVGFIGICIGAIFTIPYIYSMYYTIYDQTIGFEKSISPIDEIGKIEE